MAKKIDIKSALMKSAGLGAGVTASVMLNKIPVVGMQKPLVRGLGKLVLGTIAGQFLGGKGKDNIMEHVADGIIAGGVNEIVSGVMPGVSGIGNLNDPDGLGDVGAIEDISGLGELDPADMGAIEDQYAVNGIYDNNGTYKMSGLD